MQFDLDDLGKLLGTTDEVIEVARVEMTRAQIKELFHWSTDPGVYGVEMQITNQAGIATGYRSRNLQGSGRVVTSFYPLPEGDARQYSLSFGHKETFDWFTDKIGKLLSGAPVTVRLLRRNVSSIYWYYLAINNASIGSLAMNTRVGTIPPYNTRVTEYTGFVSRNKLMSPFMRSDSGSLAIDKKSLVFNGGLTPHAIIHDERTYWSGREFKLYTTQGIAQFAGTCRSEMLEVRVESVRNGFSAFMITDRGGDVSRTLIL